MKTSQKATRLNAISTFISGIGIMVFQKQLTAIFETSNGIPFLVVGGVITFFSLTMFFELKKQRPLAILWIITQDVLFVLANIYIIITRPFDISNTGYLLMGLFLIPIIFFIIYQSIGLAKIDSKNESLIKTLSFKRKVKATKSKVWEVISDVANYHEVAPNIDSSKVISGEKKGMIRSCSHGKNSWLETCTLWEDEKQYSFIVDTSAPDYPFPLKSLKGTWTVNETSNNQNEITMIFEFEYKKYFQNIFIHPLMKRNFTKICAKLLDNWQNKIEI